MPFWSTLTSQQRLRERETTVQVNKVNGFDQQEYEMAIGALRGFTIVTLFSLTKTTEGNLKDHIIRNFIARGAECLDSILSLWKLGRYDDCTVLQRAHTDRVIHLIDLIERDGFAEFERWSFRRQFEMVDRALSDPRIQSKIGPVALRNARELHRERRIRFNQEPESNWHRPDHKEVAKQIEFPLLYRLGYDYPSTEVHPMADDGEESFYRLISAEAELKSFGDHFVVLHNTFASQIYLVIKGLNACNVVWEDLVGSFLSQLFSFLESGSKNYMATFVAITGRGSDYVWCRPKNLQGSGG